MPSTWASGTTSSPTNVQASVAPAPATGRSRLALRAVVACDTTAQPWIKSKPDAASMIT